MSENKFTPGPWKARLQYRDYDYDLYIVDGPQYLGDIEMWGFTEEDANLIAAAPELLEALEMMLEMSKMNGFGKAAAQDVARAAIAKARGET